MTFSMVGVSSGVTASDPDELHADNKTHAASTAASVFSWYFIPHDPMTARSRAQVV